MTEEFQADHHMPRSRELPNRGDAGEFNPFRKPDPVLRRTPGIPLLLILFAILGLGCLGLVGVFLISASKPRGVTMPAPLAGSMPAGVVIDNPPQAKRMIVGVWESLDEKQKGTVEFKADGIIVVTIFTGENNEAKFEGKYKFVEDDVFEVEFTPPGGNEPKTEKVIVAKITKDELITKDKTGKEDKFRKQ